MAQEPFLINPPRKRQTKKRSGAKKRRKMSVGRLGERHRPVVYTVRGPKGRLRWQTSPKAKVAAPSVFVNPHVAVVGNPRRRHMRKNQLRLQDFPRTLQKTIPLALTGIASRVVTGMVPGMLNVVNPWAKMGVKTGVAVLGGQVVNQMLKGDHGMVWTVVGVADVVADLIQQFMPGVLPGLSDYMDYQDKFGYGDEGMTAFPEEVSAYPEEVAQYPYDGPHDYGVSQYTPY